MSESSLRLSSKQEGLPFPGPWRVPSCYLAIALLTTLALAFLTPPFQVPDEPQHFFRAYQLSEFSLRSVVQGQGAGASLPASLPELVEHFLGTRAVLAPRPVKPAKLRETLAAATPLDPARRVFVDFSNTAFYAPPAYLPQAAAMAAGRWLGLGPLGLLYAARLMNGLCAVGIVTTALRLLPFGRAAACVVALLPMVLYEFASAAPDAALIALSFLFTALAVRALGAGQRRPPEILAACLAGAAICAFKPVYAPLLLIAAPVRWRQATPRAAPMVPLLIAATSMIAAVLWFAFSAHAIHLARQGADAARQFALMQAHPLGALTLLARSLLVQSPWLLLGAIGRFGWLTIWLPNLLYALPAAAFLCAVWAGTEPAARLSVRHAAWHVALILASTLLIMFSLYLVWTPVGAPNVEGVQGRYLLPLAPLAAVTLSGALPGRSWPVLMPATLTLMAVESVLTCLAVARAYSVF